MIIKSDSFPFNPLKSKTLMTAPLKEPFLTSDRDVRASSEIGDSRPDHGRIGTPFVNINIWSRYDNFIVRSDVRELDRIDTTVQQSSTDERNKVSLRNEEGTRESICPESIKESNSSKWMNLVNSLLVDTPNLVYFGHPPTKKDNVGHRSDGSVATSGVDQHGI